VISFGFDFGIRDVMKLSRDEEVYLVQFGCGCVALVGHGRVIRRARGRALVCEHVATR
jgi:hypothetical protein